MRRLSILVVLMLLSTWSLASGTERFNHVQIHSHKSAQDRVLVNRVGTLTFDDTSRKFIFEKELEDRFDTPERVEVSYDAVTRVVFEETAHKSGGTLEWTPFVGLMAASVIAGRRVHDYWFYVEYKNGDEGAQELLRVPKDSYERVIEKAAALFGSRASVTKFPEVGQSVKPENLPDYKSKHSLRVDKVNRPLPEAKPDKATIVIVCPPVKARDAGRWNQYKLHANDRVVAVNKEGTYSFAYIEPGKYRLVSQADDANGFEMELEAGKTYYFLQNTFQGGDTVLSRNSPELVNYLMSGTYFADWSRKQK